MPEHADEGFWVCSEESEARGWWVWWWMMVGSGCGDESYRGGCVKVEFLCDDDQTPMVFHLFHLWFV